MSLESSLEEERREVLKLLESPRNRQARGSNSSTRSSVSQELHGRTSSPAGARSPVRSMLDIAEDGPATRHASIAGIGMSGVTGPRSRSDSAGSGIGQPVRSLLDTESPPPSRSSHSTSTSPTALTVSNGGPIHRSRSDAAAHPPSAGPRILRDLDKPSLNPSRYTPNADYQFDMLPSIPSQAAPRRVTQGGKKPSFVPNSMAQVMRGDTGLSPLPGLIRGRDGSISAPKVSHGHSRSPVPRLGRSQSPHSQALNINHLNLKPDPGTSILDSGTVVDLNSAYARLSDAALAGSGGSLSHLPARSMSASEHIRSDSGEIVSPSGEIRMAKDYDEEAVLGSSDEESESGGGSSGGENWKSEKHRGRKGLRKTSKGVNDGDWEDSDDGSTQKKVAAVDKTSGLRKPLSLLAAAEEERKEVSSRYKVKSLLGPPINITAPGGERLTSKRPGVHPSTSFDHASPGISTPLTSDTEADLTDIKRAQRMSIAVSPITSTPESHRVIRTIIRGEFGIMQKEAEEGLRRQRTYLVATDLSEEAAHALEWTIGTVLRDGDTMLAVYAVDEDTGTGRSGDGEHGGGIAIGEGALAVKDQAAVISSFTAKNASATANTHSPLAVATNQTGNSAGNSPDGRNRTKAEQERFHAAEDITQRCVKLLRKTRLQVRVVIEVIHCKSPKHLITEVIDFIEPTLVILGSRGRSALKGVLLGSFSNYLVTKSSVPVMVARKKLRKHSKYKTNVRLSNNLNLSGKTLATAKID